jgi:hypothetical protein
MSDRSAATDDREFEMVLDNKRLFSILFVTFVLLGIFFAMGYVLGRNSAPVETAVRTAPAADPAESATRPTAATGRVARGPEPTGTTETPPPQAAAAPQPVAPAVTREQPRPEPTPVTGTIIDPRPGQTFLQVSAVGRPEAELLVEVLVKKGFPAAVAPGPNDNLFRVLVGPAANDVELARLKGDLEQAGFKPIPRRY